MNTGKILLILGALLLGVAGTTYLMLLQADRRATAEATAGMDEPTHSPAIDSRGSESHVTEGSIGSAPPSATGSAITKNTAAAQQPLVPATPAPAPAPAIAAAPAPAAQFAQQPQPQPQAQPQPRPAPSTTSANVAAVNVPDASAQAQQKFMRAQRVQRGRDGFERPVPSAGPTPETNELVRESAKLDPLLPPPASMAPASTAPGNVDTARASTDQRSTYQAAPRSGAALTGQLVRDSSKPDPSLPPPNMAAVRAATEEQRLSSKPGVGSNPVAAALTDQLVRDSARLDPSLPPPK